MHLKLIDSYIATLPKFSPTLKWSCSLDLIQAIIVALFSLCSEFMTVTVMFFPSSSSYILSDMSAVIFLILRVLEEV